MVSNTTIMEAKKEMRHYDIMPLGSFALNVANEYFGGWYTAGPNQISMAFPVEGWHSSAGVLLRQHPDGQISGEVSGTGEDADKAWSQALATLSLDVDGTGWAEVGQRDPVIGQLQQRYQLVRPVLFHSPYEAAAAFIIGHRISIKQGRALRQALAESIGEQVQAGDAVLHAFPRPQILRELKEFKGISPEKIRRLHAVAEAALDGWLDRDYLRSLSVMEALLQLQKLPGIGEFFSQGILLRGAGYSDEMSDDAMTKEAIRAAYQLPETPDHQTVLHIAEAWRPYRMWGVVLLHIWFRRELGGSLRKKV